MYTNNNIALWQGLNSEFYWRVINSSTKALQKEELSESKTKTK